jgi:hypothetical protein
VTAGWVCLDPDVAPDGKSFVMLRPVEEHRQLVRVVNWVKKLRQRTPGEGPRGD